MSSPEPSTAILLRQAGQARAGHDANELVRIGGELERLGAYGAAWTLLAEGSEARKRGLLPLWGGPGQPAASLLVRRRMRHLGAELRNTRLIASAALHVHHVVVATEARLQPLLRRSFPQVQVVDAADPLGVPCVVLLDALPHLTWPAERTATPFYPRLQIVRQDGRAWPAVIAEGLDRLRALAQI